MAISRLRWLGNYIEDVYWNASLVDFVRWNNNQVFQRVVPAGSKVFNYTGAGQNWTIPEGITTITICMAGGGGGGGCGRGGGGGGGGKVTQVKSVTPLNSVTVSLGAGGNGSTDWTPTYGANGNVSLCYGDDFTSFLAFGGIGATTDVGGAGGSGGGAGGDRDDAGSNHVGCDQTYSGGAASAYATGGGGAGGWGDGGAAGVSGAHGSNGAASGGGGGALSPLGGYRGGNGGHGKCVISWAEQ